MTGIITQPLNWSKIKLLKIQARSQYIEYKKAMDTVDCGHTLALTVSSRVRDAVKKFNKTMDKLSKLDPTAPKSRL